MKGSSISFHANPRLTLIVSASYTLLSFLLVAIVMVIGNANLGRLITLNKCDYQYSATMDKLIGQDDYYLFEAGIEFASSKESSRGINVEVLMQIAESDYTDSVSWNARKLSTYEIAISADVARECGINVGSVLFSRHIVDGNLYEYTVTELLPFFPGTGKLDTYSFSDGIVIMGFDSKYEQNISHKTIFFTDKPITDLMREYSETPVNIAYRDDLIASTKGKLKPYLILLGTLGIMLTFAFAYALLQAVICDYKRMIILGFRKRDLSKAFSSYIILPFVLAALCTAALSLGLILLMQLRIETIWFLVVLMIVESITFISALFIMKRRVWRT